VCRSRGAPAASRPRSRIAGSTSGRTDCLRFHDAGGPPSLAHCVSHQRAPRLCFRYLHNPVWPAAHGARQPRGASSRSVVRIARRCRLLRRDRRRSRAPGAAPRGAQGNAALARWHRRPTGNRPPSAQPGYRYEMPRAVGPRPGTNAPAVLRENRSIAAAGPDNARRLREPERRVRRATPVPKCAAPRSIRALARA
jgi:hypothetical protein